MFTLKRTSQFDQWLKNLRNPIAKKSVISRLLRLEAGHFGDIDYVGDGVFELRIHVNTGIRIYAIQQNETIILVLVGGDKSTQQSDINKAKELALYYTEYNDDDSQV